MLYQLCYVSSETRALTGRDLAAILESARRENTRREITGLLLYKQGSFMQVLEGSRDVVAEVYERIRRDQRHHQLDLLFEGPIEEREFDDWSMAFVDLDRVDAAKLPGFSDFMISDEEPRRFLAELSHAKRFLLLFRATR